MELTVREKLFLFQCRTRDINVKANRPWKFDDIKCITCNKHAETQEHILECDMLFKKNDYITYIPEHSELFSSCVEDQIYISRVIFENMKIRDNIALTAHVN